MKRSLLIGGGIALFAGSAALAALIADSAQDEPRSVLPAPAADVGVVVLADPTYDEGQELTVDDVPPEVIEAGYESLTPASGTPDAAAEEPTAADGYPWPSDADSGGDTGGDSGGDTGGSDSGDGADPELVAALLGSPGAAERYAVRFIDICASPSGAALCPLGVGGTVLVPFGGEADFGPFDVFGIYATPSPFWQCDLPASLAANEYPVLVNATQPARIEIEYHPVDDPTDTQNLVVDLTDPDGDAYGDFTDYFAENGTVPTVGVHHCFVLRASPAHRSYQVTADATSTTGLTDSMSHVVDLNPRRPAVLVTPQTDKPLELMIGVPVAVDTEEYAVVRMLRVSDGRSCADIEDDMLSGDASRVVPAPGYGRHTTRFSWSDTFVPAPIGWASDVYDLDAWSVGLEESTDYLMCVWWLRSPASSFDPASMSVTERENRLIATPDTLHTAISITRLTTSPTGPAYDVDSVSVAVPYGCGPYGGVTAELQLPPFRYGAGEGEIYIDPLPLCEYPGIPQPATTRLSVRAPGVDYQTFDVPTPIATVPSVQEYRFDLAAPTRLCGEFLGNVASGCEPPFGPALWVQVATVPGASNGLADWLITDGYEFAEPGRLPEALPPEIRIDQINSGVIAIDRNSLRVTAVFDRPVSLLASLHGDPCLLGAAPTFSSAAPRSRHTFVLGGLCTLTSYAVRLEASDGSTTAIINASSGAWDGTARTDGYHVSYTVSVADRRQTTELLLASWGVRLDDTVVPLGAPSRCLEPTTSAPVEAVWGDTVELKLQVRLLSARIVGRGYCSRIREAGFADVWREVVATISIDDLRAGPVTVTVPLNGEDEVDIIIQASIDD